MSFALQYSCPAHNSLRHDSGTYIAIIAAIGQMRVTFQKCGWRAGCRFNQVKPRAFEHVGYGGRQQAQMSARRLIPSRQTK